MKTLFHAASERGTANHGWLRSKFSFSFSHYYDPNKIHFGKLRVLNDDWVAPQSGFPMHPHDNMEIITIVLSGEVSHKDTTGGLGKIKAGEIQMMTAGSGLMHSEFNASHSTPLELLQIWVFPKYKDLTPNYREMSLDSFDLNRKLTTVIAPPGMGGGLEIHQDSYFSMGHFEAGDSVSLKPQMDGNGLYVFMIEGSASLAAHDLGKRDAMGLWEMDAAETITFNEKSHLLVMEVPMN